MHVRRLLLSTSIAAAALFSSGCASIIKGGGPQSISIRSLPSEADIKIFDASTGNVVSSGKTPLIVALNKSRGFFSGAKYRVLLEKPGFASREALIDSSVNGWYIAGNLVFGGLIGWLIVDPATGAMWSLGPEEITVELSPAASPPSASAGGRPLAIVTIDELAAHHPKLLSKLKPLSQ